jgi:nucleotide-binding universal stress UspA family protein
LLATDGSPHAELAAMKAVDLAQSTGARLHVVAVGRTLPHQGVYELYTETEEGR